MRGLPSSPSGTVSAQGMLDGAPLDVDVAMERSHTGSLHALVKRADWNGLAGGQGEFVRRRIVEH
jgi:hypothetical protein